MSDGRKEAYEAMLGRVGEMRSNMERLASDIQTLVPGLSFDEWQTKLDEAERQIRNKLERGV